MKRAVTVTCVVALVGGALLPGPASLAAEPSGAGLPVDRDARQELVHGILDPVLEELRVSNLDGGFASAVANEDMTAMTIYWKGTVPAGLSDAVRRNGQRFPIKVEPAKYSLRDVSQVAKDTRMVWSDEWGTFGGLEFQNDASGFLVKMSGGGRSSADVAAMLAHRLPKWGPYTVKVSDAPAQAAVWRWNDTSPWNPGGARTASGGTWCSIAFGIERISDGAKRILTAGHCGGGTGAVHDGTGNELIGNGLSVNHYPNTMDAALINANGSTNLFVGANESDQSPPTLTVAGFGYNAVGDHVCTSGANSGEHCDLEIQDTWIDEWGFSLLRAEPADQGRIAVVGGDSGGPVYVRGQQSNAFARGMIIAGDDWPNDGCTSADYHVFPGVGHCYNDVFFYTIAALLTHWNSRMDL